MKILCSYDFDLVYIPEEMATNPSFSTKDYQNFIHQTTYWNIPLFEFEEDRQNQNVINWIESHSNTDTGLYVAEIPDNATDYIIITDGCGETVYYVINGIIQEC